jgi:rhodanese-related sulfurtransferase
MNIPQISPLEARRLLETGAAVLIDIREAGEHAREHIVAARLVPLSGLSREAVGASAKTVIFHCQSGNRTCVNFARLAALGLDDIRVLEGGLLGWKAAGLPTHLDRGKPIELQRQVMIAAGGIVLLGLLLAAVVSPWFLLLSAFVGCGLVFAGLSGRCGLALLLKRMPWNAAAQ